MKSSEQEWLTELEEFVEESQHAGAVRLREVLRGRWQQQLNQVWKAGHAI